MRDILQRAILLLSFCLLAIPAAADSVQDVITTLERPFGEHPFLGGHGRHAALRDGHVLSRRHAGPHVEGL